MSVKSTLMPYHKLKLEYYLSNSFSEKYVLRLGRRKSVTPVFEH